MKVELSDVQWLRAHQPSLLTSIGASEVVGVLSISAYYDATVNQLISDTWAPAREHLTYLSANFAVSIGLADKDGYGWPKVYDAAGRYRAIAKRYGVPVADLHFYQDGHACLGLPYPGEGAFTVRSFVASMVEPFFYRLAYVDLYGLAAARHDLWGEYSHGKAGILEHRRILRNYSVPAPAYP